MPLESTDGQAIIADGRRPSGRAVFAMVLLAALIAGTLGAIHVARLGLTLSHYDARAHLVVARRVFDSLTPGWRQLGGVWLPLPHLIDIPLVWSDWAYRTGALAVVASVAALAIGLATLAQWVARTTGSVAAACVAPILILSNPNVLYLQGTPMTEPLLLGLSCVALATVGAWIESPNDRAARWASPALAALLLVRYEGWFVGGALGLVALLARRRDGARAIARLAAWPAAAAVAFFALSWASTGHLLVTSGFYVADNPTRHQPIAALLSMLDVTREMTGDVVFAAAAVGVIVCVIGARKRWAALLPICLVAAGLLPLAAFDAGHPFRVRYMVPLAAAAGALASMAVSAVRWPRVRAILAAGLVVTALVARPPLDPRAPMVIEAQREVPLQRERQPVTDYLAAHYDGAPILASMDALGHYMQETSRIGLGIRNFVHEGNGDLWLDALASPKRHVGWVLIQARNDQRDALAARRDGHPNFLDGFRMVARAGDVTLYRRDAAAGQ
jgi:hypothetical protein